MELLEDRRLLTASEAAAYLGYASTEVLKAVPVPSIRIAASGLGAGPRYDRKALDRWLDGLSGLAQPVISQDDADQDPFEEWRLKRGRQ